MELCALGMFQPLSSNILEFFKALPEQLRQRGITFSTPSEICDNVKSVGPLMVEYPTTWVDEERDLSPWLGNVMQQEALEKLYSVADRVRIAGDKRLLQDWDYLQAFKNQGDELAIRDKEIAKLKNLIGRLEKQTGAASTETDAPATKASPTRKAASTTKKTTTQKPASAAKKSTAKKPASTTKKATSSTAKKPASAETK